MEDVLVPMVKLSAERTSTITMLDIVLMFVATKRQKKSVPKRHPAANPANFAQKSSTEAVLAQKIM
jgi:hypothetical protein